MSEASPVSLHELNGFLRGEISAVETYYSVLQKVTAPTTRAVLRECAHSHEDRVQCLRDAITTMGGTPADGSGAWGTFVGLFEGSARAFGGKAAIAALARGETQGLHDYRGRFWRLDQESKDLVEGVLLPAQERTMRAIHDLKKMKTLSLRHRRSRHANTIRRARPARQHARAHRHHPDGVDLFQDAQRAWGGQPRRQRKRSAGGAENRSRPGHLGRRRR
jgi:hypothetical protein